MNDLNTRYNNGEDCHLIRTGELKKIKRYQVPVLWALLEISFTPKKYQFQETQKPRTTKASAVEQDLSRLNQNRFLIPN